MNDLVELHGLFFEDLKVGMTAVYARTLTETDIVLFAGISGDNNPVHINEEFASNTAFSGRIAHGMLTAAFISTVLGMKLPGPGERDAGGVMEDSAAWRRDNGPPYCRGQAGWCRGTRSCRSGTTWL